MHASMYAVPVPFGGWGRDAFTASCSQAVDSADCWMRTGRGSAGWYHKGAGLLRHSEVLQSFQDRLSSNSHVGRQRQGIICSSITKPRQPNVENAPENLDKEPHKYFDQVAITVRSGDGGNGTVLTMPRPALPGKTAPGQKKSKEEKKKKMSTVKRGSDGNLILPMGGHGGDVVIYADEGVSSLLEFHRKRRYNAKRGSNVDSMTNELYSHVRDGVPAPPLRIPVPVGTVVKKKRGGKLLADLAFPGDEILVARGGHGGISIMELPKSNRSHLRPINAPTMTDAEDKVLTIGTPGEEVALELTMRVVADLGLVGLPNAGKSSLLAAVTRAKPDIADYPFTTLMPNLGRLDGDPEKADGGLAMGATVADLPGLIKDAHLGKGLGRMFLRHLRRTRLLIHIVDAAAPDPVGDYTVLREELRMYNPEYVRRPHIVVLNKLDLPEANGRFAVLKDSILNFRITSCTEEGPDQPVSASATNLAGTTVATLPQLEPDAGAEAALPAASEEFPPPVAVVGISAREGFGVEDFLKQVRDALKNIGSETKQARPETRVFYKPPSLQL